MQDSTRKGVKVCQLNQEGRGGGGRSPVVVELAGVAVEANRAKDVRCSSARRASMFVEK